MLKVCLLGVGGISGSHIRGWKNIDFAELTGICDIRPEQMEKYPEYTHYTDFEEMVKAEKPDILDICLPTFLHTEYSVRALEMGINVVCEKPVSLCRDDVAKIYGAAEKNGKKFMVAQVLRFWNEYEVLKEIYETEKYGKLLSGSMTRLGVIPRWSWDGWMQDEKRSGFTPYDLHIHDLDYMVYTFGKPKDAKVRRIKRPDQDFISVDYDFDGFFIHAEASWYAGCYPFGAKFRFQFEKAVVSNEGKGLIIYEDNGNITNLSEAQADASSEIALPKTSGYENELRYFASCVRDGKTPDKVKPEQLEQVIDILNSL